MLPIQGKPLLEHIILYLKNNGITEIGINLFTMSEQITDYFEDGKRLGVKIEYSKEDELQGTAGSLLPFSQWLSGEDFLVIYGDILTNQELAPLIEMHHKKDAFATLLLHKRKYSNSCIVLDDERRITKFYERPGKNKLKELKHIFPEGFLVNSAVQVLSNKILNYINENNCFDLPRDVYCEVLDAEKIYGFELKGERIAIDSPERYRLAQNI
jgi:NDP-sugar pyrophosphorylase family protein